MDRAASVRNMEEVKLSEAVRKLLRVLTWLLVLKSPVLKAKHWTLAWIDSIGNYLIKEMKILFIFIKMQMILVYFIFLAVHQVLNTPRVMEKPWRFQ